MKYIDADKLKTELESIYDNMLRRIKIDKDNSDYWEGKADAYRNVIDAISSLQQERSEVNLDKEIDNYFRNWDEGGGYDFTIINSDNKIVRLNDIEEVAHHFYKLGLKARK